MSRGKPATPSAEREDVKPSDRMAIEALATFFTALAEQVRVNPAFGAEVLALLKSSGLLELTERTSKSGLPDAPPPRVERATPSAVPAVATGPLPDPFAVLREGGAEALERTLTALDAPALRQVIRAHRLDPARLSARWTARDRLARLVYDQVRARAAHGKAFERV